MKRIYYHYMAVIGFFGLFILLMIWHTQFPSANFPVVMVLLGSIMPLLLPMRGLLNASLKSCTWMSFISLFYFTYGMVEAYTAATPLDLYFGLLEVFFSLLLCAGCAFFVYKTE